LGGSPAIKADVTLNEASGIGGRLRMLKKLSEQIRAWHERAADARRKAEETGDPALRADFLSLEDHWLTLAHSYEFSLREFPAAVLPSRWGIDEPAGANPGADAGLRLQEISTLLIREGNVEALYERVLDAAIAVMCADMGSMQMLCPQRAELELLAWRGFHPESAAFWAWVRLDSGSTCGQALSSGVRVVVPDVEACDVLAGTADLDSYRRSGIRAVQSTPLVSRSGRLLGMISTHWRDPHQPSEQALRALDVLARQAADLIERSKNEAALRESEERLRQLAAIVQFSDDAIISIDLDGIITSWNKGAEQLYGYTAEELSGKSVMLLVPPDRQEEETEILARIRRGERVDPYDTSRTRKDGSAIDILLTVSPVKDGAGRLIGASKIARDITERKRMEQDVRLLSHEVDHRAKNLLALVQAMVELSSADTPSGLKAVIGGRIQALARAHTLLAESRWAGADLASLVREELSPYRSKQVLLADVTGPDVRLEPGQAQAIAMVLHELTTNAVKYGALSVEAGRVRVAWSRPDDGRLVLCWAERDGPSTEAPTHVGFGTRVINQIVRHQLNGKVRLDWRAEGLVCEIELPA
jgi:PAS domain S-box-containing protein